jgi:hypothetical protein
VPTILTDTIDARRSVALLENGSGMTVTGVYAHLPVPLEI